MVEVADDMTWRRYVPIAERRARAICEVNRLRERGKDIQPVRVEGRAIARSFWGKRWCEHLESFSDYANRLPRGRTYARNGSVCHLEIRPGRIDALVSGTELYEVRIRIDKLRVAVWKSIKVRCAGGIGSLLELLQGKLSDQVMTVVIDRDVGLFPKPDEIGLACTCPDWADMCKHVAAVLYGVGNRLDNSPESLFSLRGVDAAELIAAGLALPVDNATEAGTLAAGDLAGIFDIDLDTEDAADSPVSPSTDATANQDERGGARSAADDPPKRRRSPAKRTMAAKRTIETSAVIAAPAAKLRVGRRANLRPSGASVTRLRRRLDLSVAAFAARLGVTSATVRRWECAPGRLKLQARPLAALERLHDEASEKSKGRSVRSDE